MRTRRHYIIEKDGRSLYINNGVVSSTNNRVPLRRGPLGFNDFAITWERDMAKIGVLKTVTIPLAFVEDDAQILRESFYRSNIERELYLLIKEHVLEYPTTSTYRHLYKHLYKAQFDFTTWQDDGTVVRLKADDGGIARKLKANANIMYDVPLDEYELLKMDGIVLQMTQNFLIPDGTMFEPFGNGIHLVGVEPTSKEGEAPGFASFSVFGEVSEPFPVAGDLRYFAETTQDITGINIKGSVKIAVTGGHQYQLQLVSSLGTHNLIDTTIGVTGTHELPFDYTFDGHPGEQFFLIGAYSQDNRFENTVVYKETNFSIKINSRYPTTYVKAVKPSYVFRKLLRLMGIPEDAADTSFVEQWDDYMLLSGDANRGIDGAVLKTSFDKFFQFCKVVMAAGQGVTATAITIRPYEYFYKTTNPIAIPRIKGLEVNDASDLLFNTVKIGSPAQQIDDVNGRFSFNNTHTYGTPITTVNKELNLVMDYVSDPYAIEIHRLNLEGKKTTDDKADNTVFVIDTSLNTIRFACDALIDSSPDNYLFISGADDRVDLFTVGQQFTLLNTANNNTTLTVKSVDVVGGGYNVWVEEGVTPEAATGITIEVKYRTIRREAYTSIEGIAEVSKDTIFNISLNPGYLVKRHMKYINSVLYNFPGEYLRFISTERNRGLRTVKGSAIFDQDADIPLSNERLFLPFYFDCDTEEPANMLEEMEADPNRAFVTGNNVKGFLVKAAIQPSTHQEQAYKLLAAPDTNLLTIHRDAYAK